MSARVDLTTTTSSSNSDDGESDGGENITEMRFVPEDASTCERASINQTINEQ